MATLTIRDLDDAVVERWKERARRNGRTLESEVRACLTDAVATFDREEFESGRDRLPR